MAKFKVSLPDGRVVEVEGTIDEVDRLLATYAKGGGASQTNRQSSDDNAVSKAKTAKLPLEPVDDDGSTIVDVAAIVSKIKTCDEAEKIEKQVLDKKSVLNRVLLPLYILNRYFQKSDGLTSGDVERITKELGVPIAVANASKALSETARSYVDGDKVRRKGSAVRYKLVRRGVHYFESILEGKVE